MRQGPQNHLNYSGLLLKHFKEQIIIIRVKKFGI